MFKTLLHYPYLGLSHLLDGCTDDLLSYLFQLANSVFRACIRPKSILAIIENLVLIAENIVVHVVLLGALGRKHEGLHEPSHWFPVIGELP